ncbi:hypothetical protein CDD83_5184 [Cordyceps sp. RAO-2017]|nr:hypothetical protein CDD83_5184 [Cordyceps sp. RAO-2017]
MHWLSLAVFSLLLESVESRSLSHDRSSEPGESVADPATVVCATKSELSSVHKRDGELCVFRREFDDDDMDRLDKREDQKPKEKITNEKGPLNIGQGYHTFLGKGKKVRAVLLPAKNAKRNEPEAATIEKGAANSTAPPDTAEAETPVDSLEYEFTAPTGDTSGIDLGSYFHRPNRQILKKLREEGPTEPAAQEPDQHIHARAADGVDCHGDLKLSSKLVEDYSSYLKSLDVSASAAVSGWGQSADISGHYLDHTQLEKGFKFNLESYNYSGKFVDDYGDRWIRGTAHINLEFDTLEKAKER